MRHSIFDTSFANVAHDLLIETDRFAYDNVNAGRGGPFGAAIGLFDLKSDDHVRVGDITANAVLKTGMASAHAEDQMLSPDNVHALKVKLREWKLAGREAVVIFASSGQSCQSCHSKEEIVGRDLAGEGYVKPGNVVVVYGNPFENTARVAGFNDFPYVLDLVRSDQDPASRVSMVKHETLGIYDAPTLVVDMFRQTGGRVSAIIAQGKQVLSMGEDRRTRTDRISTSEVMAVRQACHDQLVAGVQKPWLLGDENHQNPDPAKMAVLYTLSPPGALARGEAQWAAINKIVTVRFPGVSPDETREIPEMRNDQFRHLVAGGYRGLPSFGKDLMDGALRKFGLKPPHTVLTVFIDPTFKDTAQNLWAERVQRLGKDIVYNGAGSDQDLERFIPTGERRFTGISLNL